MKEKKTVLVTGGTLGIGHATVELLLERGFRVIILARDAARLAEVQAAFVARGHSATDIETANVDMGDADAIARVVPKLKLLQDGLFGLVNNAAAEILKKITDYTREDLETTWRVNMRGPVLMIQACYPFLKRVSGSVVNVGSISDRDHYETYSVYGGSKAFLNEFSQHAAKELGFDGVRINVVSPGGVDTPLMRQIEKQFSKSDIDTAKKNVPIGQRWGTSREIAEAILFCLTGPAYLHGADIRVHGGSE
jgi:NAD(P)-dependent dehydrogenase (short-subunit alcohol dehydrogenase family)